MSLLPPSLPTSTPAPTGVASFAASKRDGESSRDDAESFGDVLSRSLAASGESSGKTAGKPASSVPLKRVVDEKKTDPQEPINTAALLFIPLESRVVKAAGADGSDAAAASAAAAPSAELPTEQVPPASMATTAAADDADLSASTETQTPPVLGAPGLPATSTKERGTASAPTVLPAMGDEAAVDLPAAQIASVSTTSDAGDAGAFTGRDEGPTPEAQKLGGTDTRAEHPHAPAQAITMAAAHNAADEAASGIGTITGQSAAGQHPETAEPAVAIGAMAATVHSNAAASSSVAPPISAQAAITPEVGSAEWGKALSLHVVHMGKAGEHVAELQLNPPGLGPLKVTLSMNDNQIQALFVSAHSSVRTAVEAALPQLRTTLADSGINLGNTSVNSGSQQQAAFSENQNGQSGQPRPRGEPGYPPANANPVAPSITAPPARRGHGTGVDTYA